LKGQRSEVKDQGPGHKVIISPTLRSRRVANSSHADFTVSEFVNFTDSTISKEEKLCVGDTVNKRKAGR